MAKELWALGALDLAGRIAAKEISSREVIGAHLARIEAVNPPVNAVTVALADQAMAAAAAADQAVAAGRSLGPLHGVPFTVKENLDAEGLRLWDATAPRLGGCGGAVARTARSRLRHGRTSPRRHPARLRAP